MIGELITAFMGGFLGGMIAIAIIGDIGEKRKAGYLWIIALQFGIMMFLIGNYVF